MFMKLGPCRFKVDTMPVNLADRQLPFRLASMPVGQSAPSQQFLGIGDETVTFKAVVFPKVLSPNGETSLDQLRATGGTGARLPFFDVSAGAAGVYLGMWCLQNIGDGKSLFTPLGEAQRIEVDMSIVRDGSSGAFGGLF
ncbi:MAG: phage tail protein [Pseudomonadota bacterium]